MRYRPAICWHKFARYFDVEILLEGDRLIMNVEEVLKRVDENTIASTAGSGQITIIGPALMDVTAIVSLNGLPPEA